MNKPGKLAAAVTSTGLSLLFIAVYGGCNWITAHRHDVGTWYYGWERFIPFVPIFIVPYMSIDLFFVAAPFLCGTRAELRTFARRVAFAILVAGACFLIIPLKMGIARPQPTGWMGAVFGCLHGFDQPYNLFPSLHIALRTILAELYARHSKGLVRLASNVWFSLIGFSTLLTYQHHFVDVVGGFVLAIICFYLFGPETPRPAVIPNRRIGLFYAIGAALSASVAGMFWPWTAIMLWPAASLAVIASAYYGVGPRVFRKSRGRIPATTRLLLAPVLLGQHVSLLHYRRQSAPWNRITDHVWIGARLNSREAAEAVRQGVTAVLDLTSELSETRRFRELVYCNIPILDLTQVSEAQLRQATKFINRHSQAGIVYVHCKAGYSRTAAVVGAWLLETRKASSVEDALQFLRAARPKIIFRPEVRLALNALHGHLNLTTAADLL